MRHTAAFAGIPARFHDIHPAESAVTARQDRYIRGREFDRPTMVFDLDVMRAKYRALAEGLGDAVIHYAVKANPAPEVIAAVAALGGRFDAASRGEIDLCLSLGVPAAHIAFGNTIKRAADIAHAHTMGVEQFAVDAEEEMLKLAEHAPGARVIVRMLVETSQADWPLSRKFGCSRREALRLMDLGRYLGLDVAGIDVICEDISRSIREHGGVIVEVNAAPGFRMHVAPTVGTPRNVAAPVIDMLFPNGATARIPTAAITIASFCMSTSLLRRP